MTPVRPATAADVPATAAALARAFHDDPVTRWVYGADAGRRDRWSSRFFAWQLRRLLDQDVSWTTAAGDGAAMWALPDRWREGPADVLRLLVATLPGIAPRLPRVLRGLAQVEARHPERRHLYLAVLGVDPPRQGGGVGSALLAPGLELCDRDGLPAYLETATERNVAFYTRHGFRVTGEVRLPKGPPVWLMWRDPR
ncbi:MAG: GNAT family N-acetyltransferase [Solirubrobacterales bacterium]|nr:GNAT family N-acetyltransferase [Solirubrobacterales bacterium]